MLLFLCKKNEPRKLGVKDSRRPWVWEGEGRGVSLLNSDKKQNPFPFNITILLRLLKVMKAKFYVSEPFYFKLGEEKNPSDGNDSFVKARKHQNLPLLKSTFRSWLLKRNRKSNRSESRMSFICCFSN